MNKQKMLALFFWIGIPAFANPVVKQFDGNSLQLLNAVFNHCPIQFIQAMKGANRVGMARYTADRPGETYEITTVGGGFSPSLESYNVATLKINRNVIPGRLDVPDKPTQWSVSCELK